jgi:endonuclease/exonuclease/phosphatase family metal-dependent hydrolase
LLGIQVCLVILIAGPMMGLCVPLQRFRAQVPSGERVRVMTLNRGQRPLREDVLLSLIERERIDLICFQEKGNSPGLDIFLARGWNLDQTRMIASRLPIVAEIPEKPVPYPEYGFWPVRLSRVRLRLPSGRQVLVASAHMPTMRQGVRLLRKGDIAGLKRYSQWRWEQTGHFMAEMSGDGGVPVVVGGDFNMPADSPMMAQARKFYQSSFEEAGLGYGYTRPTNLPWMRMDQVLASPDWFVARCWVGPNVGSDHLPLIAELVLPTRH